MPKHGVTQTALHALKKPHLKISCNCRPAQTAQCPRRYCIHQLDGASCLIGHTLPKQKPARSAERRPITSRQSAVIPRVSLVKHPHIGLNQNTRNVTVGRKPCEKRFTPTWVTHELLGGRSSMINQPLRRKRTVRDGTNVGGNKASRHVNGPILSLVSNLKRLQSVQDVFCTADKSLLHTMYAWWTSQRSLCFTLTDMRGATCAAYRRPYDFYFYFFLRMRASSFEEPLQSFYSARQGPL